METEHYDENTPICLGAYKYTMIKHIPTSYIKGNINEASSKKLKDFLKEYSEKENTEIPDKLCYKKAFETLELANDSKDKLNNQNRLKKKNISIRVYECECCGFYHLTSKPLKNVKNRR